MPRIVRYQWSEDGEVEVCGYQEITTKAPMTCYHCDSEIRLGDRAVLLTPLDGDRYFLHKECADKSIVELERQRIKNEWNYTGNGNLRRRRQQDIDKYFDGKEPEDI